MIIVFFFEHRVSYDHSRHKLAERHDGLTLYVLCDLVFLRFPPRSRNWRKEEVEKYVTKKCVQVDFIAAFGATRLSVRTATAILTYFPASLLLFSAGETTSTCSPSGVVCRMSCRPGRSCVVRTRSGVMVFGHAFEVMSSFSFCASLTNTVSSSFGESMVRSVSSSSASKTTLPCVSLSGCGLNGSTSDKLTPHEYVRSTCEGNAKPAEPSSFFSFSSRDVSNALNVNCSSRSKLSARWRTRDTRAWHGVVLRSTRGGVASIAGEPISSDCGVTHSFGRVVTTSEGFFGFVGERLGEYGCNAEGREGVCFTSGVFVGAREPSRGSGLVAEGEDTQAPMMKSRCGGQWRGRNLGSHNNNFGQ